MSATIERRFLRLQATWNEFISSSDERDSERFLRLGCDPSIPWQEWPPEVLALLGKLAMDPATLAENLRVVLARRADRDIIRIVWLDRMPAAWEDPPTLIIQPGYIDMLKPDPEPRVTTMPMTPEARRKFGDEGVQLVVSYTDKTPHNSPTPAQGESMPVTAPERPQTPPQASAQPVETPYSFERAKRTTNALARANRRRIHVR